jgi:hypothetical protein
MVSLFPYLLSWSELSPLLIRLTLGAIMIYWSYKGLRTNTDTTKKLLDVAQGLVGILLVIGLWTQIAALLAAIGFIVCIVGKIRTKSFLTDGVNYMLILLVLAISLLLTGPGLIAFDIRL